MNEYVHSFRGGAKLPLSPNILAREYYGSAGGGSSASIRPTNNPQT